MLSIRDVLRYLRHKYLNYSNVNPSVSSPFLLVCYTYIVLCSSFLIIKELTFCFLSHFMHRYMYATHSIANSMMATKCTVI